MTPIPLVILDLVFIMTIASSEGLSVLARESHASCKNYEFVISFEIGRRGRIEWETRSAASTGRDVFCLQPITKRIVVPAPTSTTSQQLQQKPGCRLILSLSRVMGIMLDGRTTSKKSIQAQLVLAFDSVNKTSVSAIVQTDAPT